MIALLLQAALLGAASTTILVVNPDPFPWQAFSVATGGWLLAALTFVGFVRGRLVPRSTLEDALHDRNEWRAESRIKDAQIATKDEQLRHLASVGESQKALLSALGKLTEQESL